MTDTTKPSDPADKAADGAFGGGVNHRAGYGDRLATVEYWMRQAMDRTLASGEGRVLMEEIDRLRGELAETHERTVFLAQERDEARRQRDAFQQQFDEVQESMLEEHEDLTRHLADAQGEARTLRMTNTALVSSLRHVTAALNVLLDQLPEAKR